MKRPRRRPVQEEPEITPALALEYERNGWPTRQARREFWDSSAVPVGCRASSRPDPRAVLGMNEPAQFEAFGMLEEAWQADRLAWLAEAAGAR